MLYLITIVDTTQFLLRKFLELRWTPKLVTDDTKILSMNVENLNLLDSLYFLPFSLKKHAQIMTWHARGPILTSLARQTIWTMWPLIPNPSTMEQTTCQAMCESSFWNGTRSKTTFSAISRSSWPPVWTMSMFWSRYAVHLEISF